MKYRNISVWLEDILKAIEEIENFTAETQSYHQFVKNRIVVLATERNFEIITEALKNTLHLNSQLLISNSKKIIGLRNIINHVYYEVEYDRIWLIITKDLPVLKSEVKKILEEYESKLDLNEL
ncbi:MAG: HepT-like ribonuclease domain-containing protein [Parafilimonas sp.]